MILESYDSNNDSIHDQMIRTMIRSVRVRMIRQMIRGNMSTQTLKTSLKISTWCQNNCKPCWACKRARIDLQIDFVWTQQTYESMGKSQMRFANKHHAETPNLMQVRQVNDALKACTQKTLQGHKQPLCNTHMPTMELHARSINILDPKHMNTNNTTRWLLTRAQTEGRRHKRNAPQLYAGKMNAQCAQHDCRKHNSSLMKRFA